MRVGGGGGGGGGNGSAGADGEGSADWEPGLPEGCGARRPRKKATFRRSLEAMGRLPAMGPLAAPASLALYRRCTARSCSRIKTTPRMRGSERSRGMTPE